MSKFLLFIGFVFMQLRAESSLAAEFVELREVSGSAAGVQIDPKACLPDLFDKILSETQFSDLSGRATFGQVSKEDRSKTSYDDYTFSATDSDGNAFAGRLTVQFKKTQLNYDRRAKGFQVQIGCTAGFFRLYDDLNQELVTSGPDYGGETRTTKTGHVFTRDTSNPRLGEAWRDPSGMIWGDVAKNEDGTASYMDLKTATAYCRSIGAHLPSGWDTKENESHAGENSDYVRLREYMGALPGGFEGYAAQVLPNLIQGAGEAKVTYRVDSFNSSYYTSVYRTRNFWTSTGSNYFFGRDGYIVSGVTGIDSNRLDVRCVARR